jgi:Domain of unknown function (DUF6438)
VGEPLKRKVMRLHDAMKVILLFLIVLAVTVAGQTPDSHDFKHLTITMKAEGGPCGCVYYSVNDLSCCPAYSVSLDENGTVIYKGIGGVKTQSEVTYSISSMTVLELVAQFQRIDFYSLQDRYTSKKLPNGNLETVDHANATTISIDMDGKKKSIYIFYGAPQELIDLQRNLYDITQIAQYIGHA